ncbi:hypothetical protein KFE18_08960 [Clostridiaceae bacterium Marseille-Q4143]|nr:hypothetical protein KFE18_08960 [Clostridiaceae bacterium Marseille-Q4143]
MKDCKSYIFIKENEAIIFQITDEINKIRYFYNGLLRCFAGQSMSIEQPIQIAIDKIKNLEEYLRLNYQSDKRINKLIYFFKNTKENEYIYCYPYNENFDEIYDFMKESLKYYNHGYSQEKIACKMKEWNDRIKRVKDLLDDSPYTIKLVLPIKKVIVGESNKSKRHCIYCGGFQGNGKGTSFKEKAHAISEALGNKKFIQNEECDKCNSFFAENVEEDLSNMLMFERLQYGIKGKNGYPIFQVGSRKYARYFDWKQADYSADWGIFESVKTSVKEQKKKCPVIIDIGGKIPDKSVCISNIKCFCPMHAYKALVKCVIGLIGNEKLHIFRNTIHWLRYDDGYHKLPEIVRVKCPKIIYEPELYIFERKKEDFLIPYCYGELRIADQSLIFIIPFCDRDKKKFRKLDNEQEFKNYLRSVYGKYDLCDCSKLECERIEQVFSRLKEINCN